MGKQAQNNRLAALSLINRALRSNSASIADLLINSACRIDGTLKPSDIKSVWIEKWLIKNKDRIGANYE